MTQVKLYSVLVLLVTLSTINVWLELPFQNTFLWWFIQLAFMGTTIALIKKLNYKELWPVKLFLVWVIITIVRSFFVAENYWEWKHLISAGATMLLPLTVFIVTPSLIQKIISFWLQYALLAFFIFIPFINSSDFVGGYLVPVMILLLFLPVLPKKWQVIVLVFYMAVIIAGLDARSHIIRYTVALLLGFSFYFKNLLTPFVKIIRLILIVSPFVLMYLAIVGIFNIYKMDEYISGNYEVKVKQEEGYYVNQSLKSDTRTFLYEEVIISSLINNYFILGRTFARGYDSLYFGEHLADELKTGKMERFSSEVSIHNIFTWLGLVGVALYFLIFVRASYLAIYKSRSYFLKIIGLFVAFRWVYAFVEDFTNFSLQYLFLWVLIGICYSPTFRSLTNKEITIWVRGIFDKRYQSIAKYLYLREKLKSSNGTKP